MAGRKREEWRKEGRNIKRRKRKREMEQEPWKTGDKEGKR